MTPHTCKTHQTILESTQYCSPNLFAKSATKMFEICLVVENEGGSINFDHQQNFDVQQEYSLNFWHFAVLLVQKQYEEKISFKTFALNDKLLFYADDWGDRKLVSAHVKFQRKNPSFERKSLVFYLHLNTSGRRPVTVIWLRYNLPNEWITNIYYFTQVLLASIIFCHSFCNEIYLWNISKGTVRYDKIVFGKDYLRHDTFPIVYFIGIFNDLYRKTISSLQVTPYIRLVTRISMKPIKFERAPLKKLSPDKITCRSHSNIVGAIWVK